jgi:tetratricopeptide (TPR) repeat protein
VARSAQKRRPRKPTAAVPAKKPKPRKPERPAYEQQMFFPRLIRQAKWVFVFLALAFAVGFVLFGVGGNIPGTGIGDIIQGQVEGAGPSVGEARDKIEDNPENPTGHRELGDALVADGRGDEAIAAYHDYLELRPKDTEVKRTLAGLYMTRANNARDEYAQIYSEYQSQTGGGLFGPPQDTDFGRALSGKIHQDLQTTYSERLGEVSQRMQAAFGQAATLYRQVAATRPDDEALLQLQLGDAAYQARRIPLAIQAYERYLKLDPEGQNAAYAKQQIQLLKQGAANAPG